MRIVSYLFQSFMAEGDPRRASYLKQLSMLARSCARLGLPLAVLADRPIDGFDCCLITPEPSLMRTVLAAQCGYLNSPWFRDDTVLVDSDILFLRVPIEGFGDWDICLTTRKGVRSPFGRPPVNNGAVYCRAMSRDRCVAFFDAALARCGDFWGADQWALSEAAAPVGHNETAERSGATVRFVPARALNYAPRSLDDPRAVDAAVLHFKGWRKELMPAFAERLAS